MWKIAGRSQIEQFEHSTPCRKPLFPHNDALNPWTGAEALIATLSLQLQLLFFPFFFFLFFLFFFTLIGG